MARISEITVKEQQEYYYLSIRKTICFMAEYGDFANQCFQKIMSYLNSLDVLISDGPIVCFHNMDLEHLDVEAGFPLARSVPSHGEIQIRGIPAQKAVTAIDQGAYEKQDPTVEELFAWIQGHGYHLIGEIYYQYLNEVSRPADEYLTKMIMPVQ